MTTATRIKAQKEVTILSRLQIKADPRKVVYTCLSSDGSTKYETTLFDGKFCSCQCPARKPCYHGDGCEAREAARKATKATQRAYRDMMFDPRFQ